MATKKTSGMQTNGRDDSGRLDRLEADLARLTMRVSELETAAYDFAHDSEFEEVPWDDDDE